MSFWMWKEHYVKLESNNESSPNVDKFWIVFISVKDGIISELSEDYYDTLLDIY